MAQPYNYMLDIPNPMESINQGFAGGFNLAAKMDQSKQQREQLALQKQRQQQMNESLYYLSQNPNPENYAKVMTMFPELSDNLKKAYDTIDDGEKKSAFSVSSQAYAAIANGQPDIAKQVLNDAATAYENSGKTKQANTLKGYVKMLENNPNAARTSLGILMSSADPDKFKDIYGTLGSEQRANEMQPIDVAQKQAQTDKTIAETNDIPLAAEDRRTGVDNQGRKIEYDNQYNYDKLSQDQQQFYDNLSQQEKLEANKLRASKNETTTQRTERLEKVNSFSSAANNAASTAKLAAELINDYKKLSDSTGAGYWNAAMRNVPGTAEYNFAKRVDTLRSQAFMIGAQSLRGLGAMTEAEGKKVTEALGNLDLSQSTDQVAKQLAMIAQSANNVAKTANRNAQIYATKGQGYSPAVKEAARQLGISEAEAQKFANENGL
ncbi:hypothetical protein [Acinetobacter ursingii]|uniref:hypothetical protein n=1 Tax=Acinetobacter ursingii TaxID=108980 RepID=UPI001250CD2C|nr:hypothetical protein [Acinetobacter ursingii]